jgi:DNA-binding transcriptional LysR family regulator
MKFRQIEVFKEIMSTGTITAAAKRLHVSAPAISQMLSDFEESIQVKLFNRVKGRLVATTEAHLFLKEVDHVYMGLEHLKKVAKDLREYRYRELEIGVFPALSKAWLSTTLREFIAINSDITVTVKEVNSIQILEDTLSQQIDFGLTMVPINDPAVCCKLINKLPAVCIVHKNHPLANLEAISIQDIAPFPFISLSHLDKSKDKINELFEKEGIEPNIVMQVSLINTACHMVSENLGISIVDVKSASDYQHLNIKTIALTSGFDFTIYMVKPIYGRSSDLSDKFMSHIRDKIDY